MRIPLYIAIPLSFLAISLAWWIGTRETDFLTPPSQARLEQVRAEALASLPVSESRQDAISIVVPIPGEDDPASDPLEIYEPVEIGDLSSTPTLDTYSDRAPDGAGKLLRLAVALENRGAFQRALLAYERVLDLSQANSQQTQDALLSIRRLRPTLVLWNTDRAESHPAIIRIGTGEKFAEILPEIMEEITTDLRSASSGLVDFSFKLNIGRSIQATDAPTPVALWITGAGEDSPSTDVLSFTTDNPETLRNDLLKTVFNLVRGHLAKATSYNPAPEAVDEPIDALKSNITRLLWEEFGASLNPPPAAE